MSSAGRGAHLFGSRARVCGSGTHAFPRGVNLLGARGIEALITVDHTRNNQATLQWLFYDGHGNVVRTMSNDGLFRLSAFQFRGVWGERESDLGLGKGYCANLGHPEDETGLVYMRARYYEPATGRFISEDPSRDGVNWYLYADGNPVNRVDSDGEAGEPEINLGGGWGIRIDGSPGSPTADMHIWYKGKEIGSIWNSGAWKHLYYELSKNKTKDLIERLEAHKSKRVRGWGKVLRRAGYGISSLDTYFTYDPLDFIATLFDIAGDHETASMVDRINEML